MNRTIRILLFLTAFLPALTRAEVISATLGTGLAADGSLAEINSNDIRWTVRFGSGSETLPRVSRSGLSGSAIPAGTRGQWILPPDTTAQGRYTYRTTFDLDYPVTSTPRLQLRLAADDVIYSVRVNGQHQHNSITGFSTVDTVIVEEGLHPGMNELEIIVYNITGPTGLWCEIVATQTPFGANESLSAALVGDLLKVSWPARDPAFRLEYHPTLDSALEWEMVTTTPDLTGHEFSLMFPTDQEKGFYRLVKPEVTKPPVTRITVNPTGPGSIQPVYLASNGESTAGSISTLALSLDGALVHRFDAGDSFDPRRGNLSYDWKIFYPPSVNGGAEYTGSGLSGAQASALQIAQNSLPDIGTNAWRAQLTVTSDAGGQHQSQVAEFYFRYVPNVNMSPVVAVVVDPSGTDYPIPQEVKYGCINIDGCILGSALDPNITHVFDASASFDPRGGTLSYRWEIRFPTSIFAGQPYYTHPAVNFIKDDPVITIPPNGFPDTGGLFWRVRLLVTNTLPDGSVQSKEVRFRFSYPDSSLSIQAWQESVSPN